MSSLPPGEHGGPAYAREHPQDEIEDRLELLEDFLRAYDENEACKEGILASTYATRKALKKAREAIK